jgi:hypothetical protein
MILYIPFRNPYHLSQLMGGQAGIGDQPDDPLARGLFSGEHLIILDEGSRESHHLHLTG